MAHRGRPHKGQQRELDGAVAVIEYDLLGAAGETPGNVYVLFSQQTAGKVEPLGAVVVAGDGQHRDAACGQLGQEPVQQRAGRGGRHRRVVDVARDDDGLDAVFFTEGQNLFKDEPLILQHIKPVDPFAQVQVCKVQKFHGVSPDFAFTAL